MARIPAAQIAGPRESSDRTASSRVLKSGILGGDSRTVMIGTPVRASVTPEAKETFNQEPVEAPTAEIEQLKQRLSSSQRSMERRLAKEVAEAREAALEDGFQRGQAAAVKHIESERANLMRAMDGVTAAWDSLSANSEPLLAELAFKMVEAILESPLPENMRALSTGALSDAMEKLADSRSVQVSLHPADYMMLDESAVLVPLTHNHPNISWRTDASMERGDWEAQSAEAVIRRVAKELLADLRSRLSHLNGEDA